MASDLHIHTSASDGRLSPEQIIEIALQKKLNYIAITDHDTIDGLLSLEKLNLLNGDCIKIIKGIEFSADMPEHEVHILGYHIDLHHEILQEKLKLIVAARWQRLEKILNKLNALGYLIHKDEVLKIAGNTTSIGRAHIARVLVEKGYFERLGEVFAQLLGKNCPAYEPHDKLTCKEIINLIHQSNGIAVVAHPGMIGDDGIVQDLIDLGIDGIEVFHPKHHEADRIKYENLAKRYRLLITGGSDYHAIKTRYPEMLGMFTISDDLAESLYKKSL